MTCCISNHKLELNFGYKNILCIKKSLNIYIFFFISYNYLYFIQFIIMKKNSRINFIVENIFYPNVNTVGCRWIDEFMEFNLNAPKLFYDMMQFVLYYFI